jgi:hypothetical protein
MVLRLGFGFKRGTTGEPCSPEDHAGALNSHGAFSSR